MLTSRGHLSVSAICRSSSQARATVLPFTEITGCLAISNLAATSVIAAVAPAVDQAFVWVAPVRGVATPRHARRAARRARDAAVFATVVDCPVVAICAEQRGPIRTKDHATIEGARTMTAGVDE